MTALASAPLGGLVPLGRLWRTEVLRDLPTNNLAPTSFAPAANGGRGVLFLPEAGRAVTRTGADGSWGTEPVFPVTAGSGSGDDRVPAAIRKSVRRRIGGGELRQDTIVFPQPVATCVGGTTPGQACTTDADCGGTVLDPGACGVTSRSANCGNAPPIPCDPRDPGERACGGLGVCPDLGGEVGGGALVPQSITLDDTIGSRIGDPASQGVDATDGFLLRDGIDLIVFIAEPEGDLSPLRASAAGFLVGGECASDRAVCGSSDACTQGACLDGASVHKVLGTVRGDGVGATSGATVDEAITFVGRVPAPIADFPTDLAIAPGGRHVYLGRLDGLDVYRLNRSNGVLTRVQALADGADGIESLSRLVEVAVSGDGRFVVATSGADNAVSLFERDARTGSIALADVFVDEENQVDNLFRTRPVAVTEAGDHVYVAGLFQEALAVLRRVPDENTLELVQTVEDFDGDPELVGIPKAVVLADHGGALFAATTNGAVAIFDRDTATGELILVQVLRDGVDGVDGLGSPLSLVAAPGSFDLYVTSGLDRTVTQLRRSSVDGMYSVAATSAHPELIFQGGGVLGMAAAGDRLYLASPSGKLGVFERGSVTGSVSLVDVLENGVGDVDGLAGGIAVEEDPQGTFVFVGGQTFSTLVALARGFGGQALDFVGANDLDEEGVQLSGPISIALARDGRNAYVTSSNDNALVVFERDPATGALAWLERTQEGDIGGVTGLRAARHVIVGGDDAYVYVGGQQPSAVAQFARDPALGVLDYLGAVIDLPRQDGSLATPLYQSSSPDGHHIYVGVDSAFPVAALLREESPAPGLSLLEAYAEGLSTASFLEVSPDGEYVYTGSSAAGVGVFARDDASGLLTFLDAETEVFAGLEGSYRANSLALSRDDRHLYVGSPGVGTGAIAALERNPATGGLTRVDLVVEGEEGVEGLDSVSSLAITPQGDYLFATNLFDSALVVFERDPATGALTYVTTKRDDVDGVDGMSIATFVKTSEDGRYAYVVGFSDNAVAIFRINR